jgi:hypothetical protein
MYLSNFGLGLWRFGLGLWRNNTSRDIGTSNQVLNPYGQYYRMNLYFILSNLDTITILPSGSRLLATCLPGKKPDLEIQSNIYIDLVSSISSPSPERICRRFCCLSSEKRAFVLALLAVDYLGDPTNSQIQLVNFVVLIDNICQGVPRYKYIFFKLDVL